MRRLFPLLFLGLLLVPLLTDPVGAQEVDITPGERNLDLFSTQYNQTIDDDERAYFQWLVRNTHDSLSAHVSIYSDDLWGPWQSYIYTEDQFSEDQLEPFTVGPGEGQTVNLVLWPDRWEHDSDVEVTLTFVVIFDDGGTEAFDETVSVQVQRHEVLEEEEKEDEKEPFLLFGSIPFDLGWLRIPDNGFARFFFQFLLWMLISAIVAWVINPITRRVAKRTKTKIDDVIVDIIQMPVFLLVLFYGTKQSLPHLELPGHAEGQLITVFNVLTFIVLIYMMYRLFKDVLVQYILEFSKTTKTDVDQYILVPIIEKLGMVLIGIVTMVYLLSMVGIDPSALLAGSVVIGMVLGFALQDTLSNFFAGIIMTMDQPFRTGDVIILDNGDYCRIEKVGMRSVRMYNLFEHEDVIVPNNVISTQKIVNVSRPDQKYKVKVSIGAAYGVSLERMESLLKSIAAKHPEVMKTEGNKPFVRLKFGDSSVDFTLICWVDDFNNQWRVAYELRQSIYNRMNKLGIEIPFPQHDIHFRDRMNVHMETPDEDRALKRKAAKKKREAAGRKTTKDGQLGKEGGGGETGMGEGGDD